ncbi:MAG: hypothetical protein ABFS03_00795 [Chloroflexota bacterium]
MMGDLPWLRLYTDTVDNEKLRLLAFEDRWHFIALLCLKQQGILDQNNELLERKIAVKLGVQLRELDEIKSRLMGVHLIDSSWLPIGWENKQFKSDSSTVRTRKYRKNKEKKSGNVTGTSQERSGDGTDTDTDTDTEQIKKQKSSRFTPPTLDQVNKYINEKSFDIDGDKFINFYEAKGWMIGKNKMKSWKACLRTWNTKNTPTKKAWEGAL